MKLKFLKGLLIGYILLVPVIVSGNDIIIEPPIPATSVPALIERIVNWVFYIGIILAPLMFLWGALTFMTAAGRPDKIETGKKIIFWTIVGLAIILFSRAIISIVQSLLAG